MTVNLSACDRFSIHERLRRETLRNCMRAVRVWKAQSRLSAFVPHLGTYYKTSQEYPTRRNCGLQPERGSGKYLDLFETLNKVLLVTGEPTLNAEQSATKFCTRTGIALLPAEDNKVSYQRRSGSGTVTGLSTDTH